MKISTPHLHRDYFQHHPTNLFQRANNYYHKKSSNQSTRNIRHDPNSQLEFNLHEKETNHKARTPFQIRKPRTSKLRPNCPKVKYKAFNFRDTRIPPFTHIHTQNPKRKSSKVTFSFTAVGNFQGNVTRAHVCGCTWRLYYGVQCVASHIQLNKQDEMFKTSEKCTSALLLFQLPDFPFFGKHPS